MQCHKVMPVVFQKNHRQASDADISKKYQQKRRITNE